MSRRDNTKGWIFFTVMVLVLGLVGHLERAGAREVVCMPSVQDPTPPTDTKVPVRYTF